VSANVNDKVVIFGLPALERVWAYIWFYLEVFDLLQKYEKGVEIDFKTEAAFAVGRQLVLWAHKCETEGRQSSWPENLPRPDGPTPETAKMIEKVNTYFYYVISFMQLHEIGHVELKHFPDRFEDKKTSYEFEFAADEFAATFMLEKWKEHGTDEKIFRSRITGIALGIAILIGIELYYEAARDTHPNVAELLLRVFEKFNPESPGPIATTTDLPMYLCSTIVQVHLMNAKVKFDFLKPYPSITDYLIAAHRALEMKKSGRSETD
jgi:hypothetical protein